MAEIDPTSAGNVRKARNRGFPFSVLEGSKEVWNPRIFLIFGDWGWTKWQNPPPPKKKEGIVGNRDYRFIISIIELLWYLMPFDAIWWISWSQEAAAVDLYCNWVDVGTCSDRIDLQAKQKQHSRSLLVQCMGKVWSLGNTRIGVFPACLCFSSFTHWRYAGYELEWEELIKVADWEWLLGVRLQRSQFSTSAR